MKTFFPALLMANAQAAFAPALSFAVMDGTPFNLWFSMDSSPAEGYVHHNTITGGGFPALIYCE